jgi:hypothetical protein
MQPGSLGRSTNVVFIAEVGRSKIAAARSQIFGHQVFGHFDWDFGIDIPDDIAV